MTQTYTKQTITTHHREDRSVPVEAMVAVGTGLAYHRDVSNPCVYVITHVHSGYGMCSLSMQTEAEIETFLERVVTLDPDRWNIDLPTLKKRYRHNRQLRAKIEQVHYETRSPIAVFMYAEYTDGEIIPESTDALPDPQDPFNLALAASIFADHNDAAHNHRAIQVRLVRMDERTGVHETLSVYQWPDVAAQVEQQAMEAFLATPSYVERFAFPREVQAS